MTVGGWPLTGEAHIGDDQPTERAKVTRDPGYAIPHSVPSGPKASCPGKQLNQAAVCASLQPGRITQRETKWAVPMIRSITIGKVTRTVGTSYRPGPALACAWAG